MTAVLLGGCAARSAVSPEARPPVVIAAAPRIVTSDEVTTEAELAARAEEALLAQRWAEAAAAYTTLVRADPSGPHAAEYAFDLALALEGSQDRERARDAFLDVAHRYPDAPKARAALVRAATLDAYLEQWASLVAIGDELLGRGDLDPVERLLALGARGLGRIEQSEDASAGDHARATLDAAARDVYDALDLADQLHYGERDVLPVAVAQARFALGELRRVRSERIRFDPMPVDFIADLEARCGGLLQAQAAYAQAVRSVDPHWAAMAGYRVGAMYRALHRELTAIPPPASAKTQHQKDAFFAFMHVRYRVLLEKGLKEIEQTIDLGERTSDSSPWIDRARQARDEMQAALADEHARMAAMPFTEADIKEALDILTKRAAAPSPHGRARGTAEGPRSSL